MKKSTLGWTGAALIVGPVAVLVVWAGIPWWLSCWQAYPWWTAFCTSLLVGFACLLAALPPPPPLRPVRCYSAASDPPPGVVPPARGGVVPKYGRSWGSDVYHRPDPETECPVASCSRQVDATVAAAVQTYREEMRDHAEQHGITVENDR